MNGPQGPPWGPQGPPRPPQGGVTLVAMGMILALVFCLNQFVFHWVQVESPLPGPDESAADPPPAVAPPIAGPPKPVPDGVPEIVDPGVATTICNVARELGANPKVLLSAYEAALVESTVRNLDYGDRDSLGVFQQRPSQGWGTPAQIMDPVYASRMYISRAIVADRQNPGLSPGILAQTVQRSGFPYRYDQREGEAKVLVAHYCV